MPLNNEGKFIQPYCVDPKDRKMYVKRFVKDLSEMLCLMDFIFNQQVATEVPDDIYQKVMPTIYDSYYTMFIRHSRNLQKVYKYIQTYFGERVTRSTAWQQEEAQLRAASSMMRRKRITKKGQ